MAVLDSAQYKEGLYIADFEDGDRIERPFLYRATPNQYDPESYGGEIVAFADDPGAYAYRLEMPHPIEERAIDEDGVEWGAKWCLRFDHDEWKDIRYNDLFYFADETFWAGLE